MFGFVRSLFFSKKKLDYKDLPEDFQYYTHFGLEREHNFWIVKDYNKLSEAYKRACENRDFEIDKFWTRTAYFWGFIVLIFGAYFTFLSAENSDDFDSKFYQLILICLGLIFSTAWFFVIKGSKKWQENWEAHIDALEDFVTGPIYKTIFHKGPIYSVSKINLILSFVVFAVWFGILFMFLIEEQAFPWQLENAKPDWDVIITIALTILFIISISMGYARNAYLNQKNRFIRRKNDFFY